MGRTNSPARRLALVALTLVGHGLVATSSVGAQSSAGRVTARFGIAHIDLLDAHLIRQPGGPPGALERFTASQIAERYRRAKELGVGWHRWSLYHDLIEHDGFQWAVPDSILSRDVAAGLATLAVLQGRPLPGQEKPIFRQADGGLTDDPAAAVAVHSDNPWARFVSAVVERYRPGGQLSRAHNWPPGAGIVAWEIGNEPNNAHFWPGSVEEYVRFLEVSYLVIRFHQPDAIVLHGGIGDGANALDWYARFLAVLAERARRSALVARHNYYSDRVAWHWYTAPPNLVGAPGAVRALLRSHGIPPKPLWITELGLPIWSEYPGPCWDPTSPGRGTLGEQAAFLWQAIAEGLAEQVELFVVFQLYDDCGNGETSYDALGLVRNHETNQCWAPVPNQGCWHFEPALAGVPRPAFASYQRIIDLLGRATVIERRLVGPARWVTFRQPAGGHVTIAWNASTSNVTAHIPARADRATVQRLEPTGVLVSSEATANGAAYRLQLPRLTNRNGPGGTPLVYGGPVVLVEGPGSSAVPQSQAWSRAGLASAPPARDTAPPVLAVVRELPAQSPPSLELEVLAADDVALDAYVVYYSADRLPSSPAGWIPIAPPAPWPGKPRVGVVRVPFRGLAGHTYFFTAQAGDTSGNWTALSSYAQAATVIQAKPATTAAKRQVSGGRTR